MDLKFVENPRDVTAEWHLRQVTKWLNYDDGRELDNVLVYASLELRCAIERSIFETLYLIKGELTSKEEKQCRNPSAMFNLMKQVNPQYRKNFEFTKIYLSVMSYPTKITLLNTRFLTKKWHELSDYCHQVLKPSESFQSPNREFQKTGFEIIKEVIDYYYSLQNTQKGYVNPGSMSTELRNVYEEFVQSEIDEKATATRLRIMLPVLEMKYGLGKIFKR